MIMSMNSFVLSIFIGLPSFQSKAPFARTLLVEWRKRIDLGFVIKANDLLRNATPVSFQFRKQNGSTRYGTLIRTEISGENVCEQFNKDASFARAYSNIPAFPVWGETDADQDLKPIRI